MTTKTFVICCAMFSAAILGRSQGTLTWSFDSTDYIVQPTDLIVLSGTITNASDSPILISSGGGLWRLEAGNVPYDFSWLLNINGDTVPAHGVLTFDFGELTPGPGGASPGTYQAAPDQAAIQVDSVNYLWSDNTFEVTVVPEPSVMLLGVTGAVCLSIMGIIARRQRPTDQAT